MLWFNVNKRIKKGAEVTTQWYRVVHSRDTYMLGQVFARDDKQNVF